MNAVADPLSPARIQPKRFDVSSIEGFVNVGCCNELLMSKAIRILERREVGFEAIEPFVGVFARCGSHLFVRHSI